MGDLRILINCIFAKIQEQLSSGLISGIRRMFRLFYIKPKLSCSSTSVLIKTTNFSSKYCSNVRQIFRKVYIFNNRTEKVGFITLHVNRRTTRRVLHCGDKTNTFCFCISFLIAFVISCGKCTKISAYNLVSLHFLFDIRAPAWGRS